MFSVSYDYDTAVFGSDFQYYRSEDFYAMDNGGWVQSLDGGFVTFDVYGDSSLQRDIRNSSGSIVETETYAFGGYIEGLWISGYSVVVVHNDYNDYSEDVYEELIFDVDGNLLSRAELDGLYDRPKLENAQVILPRRAYRTKGDDNAIPLPKILSVTQRPATTLVDISYRVEDADDDLVTVGILASMTDEAGQSTRLPLATLVGGTAANLGANVPTNTDLTVTWDAGVDWGAAYGDVSFDIYVNDGRPLLGFHMLTLPLPDGDLTISRSPVNDLEFKEALFYLWATGQSLRLDAGQQLVGQGGIFEGVLLGSPDEPLTEASRALVLNQFGLEAASAEQVEAARQGFDADTVYQFEPTHPIRGDLFISSQGGQLPAYVNEMGFDSLSSYNSLWWVVPAATLRALPSSVDGPSSDAELAFTILDPANAGWSLSTSADWLSINGPTSGIGSAVVNLTLDPHTDVYPRSTSVEVNGGAASVSVTQTGEMPDDFADRATLSGSSIELNNALATLEANEPSHYNGDGQGSLWLTYTPSGYGWLNLSLSSEFGTFISVYTGTDLSSLSLVRESSSGVEFYANQGQIYYIAVGSRSSETGEIRLSRYFYEEYDDYDYYDDYY